MTERYPLVLPAGVAAALLLGALGAWPYGYFVFLRWVVCLAALLVAFRAHEIERAWTVWTFGLVAILFNPLLPIYLTRELWAPIDVVTAVLFGVAIVTLREPAEGNTSGHKRETRSRAYSSEAQDRPISDGSNYVRRGLDLASKLQTSSKRGRRGR